MSVGRWQMLLSRALRARVYTPRLCGSSASQSTLVPILASSYRRLTKPSLCDPLTSRSMSAHHGGESTFRPEPDTVLKNIADYVHNYQIDSALAWNTARLCLIDTIGCGLEGLRFPDCTKLLGPVVEGTIVPNGLCIISRERALFINVEQGTKIPGTNYQLDPVRGAFNIGTAIRWLDFNDCFLAAECTVHFRCITNVN